MVQVICQVNVYLVYYNRKHCGTDRYRWSTVTIHTPKQFSTTTWHDFFTFRQIIKNTQYLETERVTVNDAIRLGHLLADGGHAFVVLRIAEKKLKLSLKTSVLKTDPSICRMLSLTRASASVI